MMYQVLERLARLLFSLICFTVYLFFFAAVLANTLNANLYHFLLG